jgi:hypothetical protein
MTSIRRTRLLPAIAMATAFAAGAALAPVANAAPPRHEEHHDYHHEEARHDYHDWHHRDWGGPPVVYGAPGYAYAPPPVVYGPQFGITLPGVSIGVY